MKEVQNKAKFSKQSKAFQSNKTLLVQTHEHFQTDCTGQDKIVWECREGKAPGFAGAMGTWPLAFVQHLVLANCLWGGGTNNSFLFMKKKWHKKKSEHFLGVFSGLSKKQSAGNFLCFQGGHPMDGISPLRLMAARSISHQSEWAINIWKSKHSSETPDSKPTETWLFNVFHKPVCGTDHLSLSTVAIKTKHIKTKTYLQQILLCQDKQR